MCLAEDPAYNKPRPELKHLGTITVELYYVRASQGKLDGRDKSKDTTEHENIHEKHLKGQAISTQAK